LHTIRPSLIRVEADEATYNLHIAARFELERRLVRGDLSVAELPGVWDDTYEDLLGIRPANAAEGVLQDIHWGMGALGYFPTYTLGNLIDAQLYEAAERELGDLAVAFEEGEFGALLGWLRDRIHRHGSFLRADELVRNATGEAIGTGAFLRRITRITEEVYGIGLPST